MDVTAPTTVEFQIAVAPQPGAAGDRATVIHVGRQGDSSNRDLRRARQPDPQVRCRCGQPAGPATPPRSSAGPTPAPCSDIDLSTYLRPSRYAEADKFFGFAATEFGDYTDSAALLEKVSSWVGTRLDYVPGSSDPIDGAVDTLLAGAGVCRDYAHLVVALLRAVNVPARLVAVYAPGCQPMDFHAVAEAFVDGVWRVVDATCLAPRQTMVRIATGRDAADTAFLDNHKGGITLNNCTVTAVVDGELPADSVEDLVSLG